MESDDIPSPSSSPSRESYQHDSFYEKYDKLYAEEMNGPNGYAGEYLTEATKLFLKSQNTTDYVVVQPSIETPAPLLSDTTNTNKTSPIREDRVKTYNGDKKHHHIPNLTRKHHHPEPTPDHPYQCETCDMLFKSLELLSDHQKTLHDNNRQFACRYCSKRFNDKYNMRKHVLIHVGEKRHKCQFCDKAFLRKDHLRSHLQTHYNRKFGCKVCGKSFRTIELYQRHAKTHKNNDHLAEINNLENLQPELDRLDGSMVNDGKPRHNGTSPHHNGTSPHRHNGASPCHYNGTSPPHRDGTPPRHNYSDIKREPNGKYEDSLGDDKWNRSGSPTFSDVSGGSVSHSSPRGMDYNSSNENDTKKILSKLIFLFSYI